MAADPSATEQNQRTAFSHSSSSSSSSSASVSLSFSSVVPSASSLPLVVSPSSSASSSSSSSAMSTLSLALSASASQKTKSHGHPSNASQSSGLSSSASSSFGREGAQTRVSSGAIAPYAVVAPGSRASGAPTESSSQSDTANRPSFSVPTPIVISGSLQSPSNYVGYTKSDFIKTASGNKVSRKSVLCGSQNIQLAGRSVLQDGVVLRGDLSTLRIGRYVMIDEHSTIRPPTKTVPVVPKQSTSVSTSCSSVSTTQTESTTAAAVVTKTTTPPPPTTTTTKLVYCPVVVHDFVLIGKDCTIEASSIGSNVIIQPHCSLGSGSVVADNVKVLAHSIVPEGSVLSAFSVWAGAPARRLSPLAEGTLYEHRFIALSTYRQFVTFQSLQPTSSDRRPSASSSTSTASAGTTTTGGAGGRSSLSLSSSRGGGGGRRGGGDGGRKSSPSAITPPQHLVESNSQKKTQTTTSPAARH